jgi:hypothetical protein
MAVTMEIKLEQQRLIGAFLLSPLIQAASEAARER